MIGIYIANMFFREKYSLNNRINQLSSMDQCICISYTYMYLDGQVSECVYVCLS